MDILKILVDVPIFILLIIIGVGFIYLAMGGHIFGSKIEDKYSQSAMIAGGVFVVCGMLMYIIQGTHANKNQAPTPPVTVAAASPPTTSPTTSPALPTNLVPDQPEVKSDADAAKVAAAENARLKAEIEAKIATAERARAQAETEAKLAVADQARLKAETDAKLAAAERARIQAETQAKAIAEGKVPSEPTKPTPAEQTRIQAETQAKAIAESKIPSEPTKPTPTPTAKQSPTEAVRAFFDAINRNDVDSMLVPHKGKGKGKGKGKKEVEILEDLDQCQTRQVVVSHENVEEAEVFVEATCKLRGSQSSESLSGNLKLEKFGDEWKVAKMKFK